MKSGGRPRGAKNRPKRWEYRVGIPRRKGAILGWKFHNYDTRGRALRRLAACKRIKPEVFALWPEARPIIQVRAVSPWIIYEVARDTLRWPV